MNLVVKAKDALRLPDSYWPGSDDEGVTWGRIGVGRTRDSSPRDMAIFDGIWEHLHGKFPRSVRQQTASDSLFGWTQEILIKVLYNEHKGITVSNITKAFKYAVEYGTQFESTQLEDKIVEYELEETHKNIGYEWPAMADAKSPEKISRVHFWLTANGYEPGGDDGCWYHKDEILAACFHLDYMDHDYHEEWIEWMEANPEHVELWLSTGPFVDPNQGVLV